MAGGKESPRQKMINMMYLVLTAMLALQVSNAILQKFVLLNNSLQQANGAADDTNKRLLASIDDAVKKSGGKYADVYSNATVVREKTSALIAYIEGLKNNVINDAGGGRDPETNQIKNLSEEEKVAHMFIGVGKNGKGYELANKLNAYVSEISKYAPSLKLKPLAVNAKDDPALAKTDAVRGKDFSELMFESTPVPAALAGLSQKQSELRRYESEVLGYLAEQVGAKEIKFDKIFAVVIPDARTVVAGQTYKADIAIGAYSTSISPRISINGSGLPVVNGKGTYEVRTSGGAFDANGQLKRSYTATVSYPKPDGSIETVTQQEEYTVLKPSVTIMSQSMPPLYFKCANKLQTSSPGLGSLFKPTFSGSGADFIAGGGGKVTIVPNSAKVSMEVKNDGIVLETFPFPVRRVPKPTIVASVNNSKIGDDAIKRGLPASSVRIINVAAVADEDFRLTNPEDASFRVASYDIFLANGTRPKGSIKGQSGAVNVGSLAAQAEPGDRYLIVVNKVERRNYKGEIEEVNVGDFSVQIPLR